MLAMRMSGVKAPLEAVHVADPMPGFGQVRIRLMVSGLCGTDVHAWEGDLPVPLPIVLGHEPAGVVDMVGEGVVSPKVGDRVGVSWFQDGCRACAYCEKRQFRFCAQPKTWLSNGGSFAEFMIVEAEGCMRIPDAVSFEMAAPLFCGGFSAMSAYRAARPQGGERVAVIGLGGLGHLALQVAKANGHEVIALTNSEWKLEDAKAMGADEAVLIGDDAGKALMGVGGADVVLSFSPSMKQNSAAMEGLLPGGRLVTTAVSGEPIQGNPVSMLFKQTSIIGSAHNDRADLVDMFAYVAEGRVKPVLERYRLDEVNAVIERLIAGKVRHRAVLGIGKA